MIINPYRFGVPYSETSSAANAANGAAGYTFFNREFSVDNNAVVLSIGIYSTTAGAMKVKLALRNSATSYTMVVDETVTHGGGGWQDFTLASPYTVPASGVYYVGAYQNLASINSVGPVARSVVPGDATGTNNSIVEANSDSLVLRASGFA